MLVDVPSLSASRASGILNTASRQLGLAREAYVLSREALRIGPWGEKSATGAGAAGQQEAQNWLPRRWSGTVSHTKRFCSFGKKDPLLNLLRESVEKRYAKKRSRYWADDCKGRCGVGRPEHTGEFPQGRRPACYGGRGKATVDPDLDQRSRSGDLPAQKAKGW